MAIITQLNPWQARFADMVRPYEGFSATMYLDTVGLVTVGWGCQIARSEAATLPFTYLGKPCPADAILTAYDKIAHMPAGKLATFYAGANALVLPPFAIQALLEKRILSATAALHAIFPVFGTWPDAAKIAVCEMEWGLGDYKLRVQYPKFIASMRATPPDFTAAAAESTWSDPRSIYRNRNANRFALLMQAAKEAV